MKPSIFVKNETLINLKLIAENKDNFWPPEKVEDAKKKLRKFSKKFKKDEIYQKLKALRTLGIANEFGYHQLLSLLEHGILYTHCSSKYGIRCLIYKNTLDCLNYLGLVIIKGNDAPRGGADGKYWKINLKD